MEIVYSSSTPPRASATKDKKWRRTRQQARQRDQRNTYQSAGFIGCPGIFYDRASVVFEKNWDNIITSVSDGPAELDIL